MNKKKSYKRNSKFQSKIKKSKKKLFIKDHKNIKFKKRRNKKILKFLQNFDLKIDKTNAIYIYAGALLVMISIASFIALSPYFKISVINIVRQDNLSHINIAYKALENIRGSHIFLQSEESIEERIKSYQENIQTVTVSKSFPNEVNIEIGSYKPVFNTVLNNKNYVIVENGSLIPEKENADVRDLRIITTKNTPTLPDYKKTFKVEHLQQLSSIYDEIKLNLIRIQIEAIAYYPIERESIVTIAGGTQLIFDLEEAIIPQVKRLAIFDTENLQIDLPSMIYIDLRIQDKVFYCTSETEFQCMLNLKNIYPQELSRESI